jgi:ParB-like chromosome segregation protein Spo0J
VKKLIWSGSKQSKAIRMQGGWEKELREDKVARFVALLEEAKAVYGAQDAYKHSGLPPAILDHTSTLWAGRNRYAAAVKVGVPIDVKMYEFEDKDEARILAVRENLDRKNLTPDEIRRDTALLVELETRRIEKARSSATKLQNSDGAEGAKPGRPRSARGEAIDKVAAEVGVSRQAIKKRLDPAARAAEAVKAMPPPGVIKPTIQTWGLDVPAGVLLSAESTQLTLAAVDRLLRDAQAKLGELEERAHFPPALAKRLYEQVHAAARAVRGARPVAHCPWCAGVVPNCPSCGGTLLRLEGDVSQLPEELTRTGDEKMVCRGPNDFIPIAHARGLFASSREALQEAAALAVSRSGGNKRVQVVDENGKPLLPPDDDDEGIPF